MNLVAALFTSSIGRKILMAVTGFLLVVWVTGHLLGNLHIFGDPDEINGYAHFLHSLGPLLWIERIVLLVVLGLHIWAGVVLSVENLKARPARYSVQHTIQATLASRTMRMTGLIVFFFLLYHLAQFTVGVQGHFFTGETFKTRLPEYTMRHDYHLAGFLLVREGTLVDDVYTMTVRAFANPLVSGFYILAVGLLAFHLWHGIQSMFQTLGLRTNRWSRSLNVIARVFCIVYFAGNLAIPGAVLLGRIQPMPANTAAASASTRAGEGATAQALP